MQRIKNFETTFFYILIGILFLLSFFCGNMLGIVAFGINLSIYRILLVLICFLTLFEKNFWSRSFLKAPNFTKILFIWLVYSIFQSFFSHDIDKSFKLLLIMLSVCFLSYLAFTYITNKNAFKFIIACLLIAVTVIIFCALYETLFDKYLQESEYTLKNQISINIFNKRTPVAFLGNPNDLALFCLFGNSVILIALALANKWYSKIILIALFIANMFVWISCGSRLGYISIFIFIFMFLIINLNRKIVKTLFLIAPFIVTAIIIIATIYIIKEPLATSDSIRLHLIINGIKMLFSKSGGFGIGLGEVEYYMQYYPYTQGIVNLHAFIVEILVTSGIPIFIFLTIGYSKSCVNLYQIRYNSKNKQIRNVSKILFSFMITFIIASFGPSYSFDLDFLWSFFVLIMAFIEFNKTISIQPSLLKIDNFYCLNY